MNQNEIRRLLVQRSALTRAPYSDAVIDVWQQTLDTVEYTAACVALVAAARTHDTITPAHIIEHLPRRAVSTERTYLWDGPTDRGRQMAAQIKAHLRYEHADMPHAECPTCAAGLK